MIGKNIFNISSMLNFRGNKDLGHRALVLILFFFSIVLYPKGSFSQNQPAAKVKPKTSSAAAPSKAATGNVDENSDDTEDAAESDQAEDNTDTAETLEANSNPTEEKTVAAPKAGDFLEDDNEDTPAAVAEEESIPPPPDKIELQQADKKTEPAYEPIPVQPTDNPKQPIEQMPLVEIMPELPAEKLTAADMVEVIPKEKNVEVELRKQYRPYKERRTTHGFMFDFNGENLYFPDYMSILDQKLYEELFGQEDLTLLQFKLNYKLNFFMGALTAGVGYGQGTLIDDRFVDETTGANQERTLTLSKSSIQAQWLLDSLMKEPYAVPYVGMSYWQIGISEKNNTTGTSASYDTGYGTAVTAGILIQLNWIEKETAKLAYLGEGLENTYLDVFWTQYQNTDEEFDPAFENDFNFGVGLRLEF